MGTVTVELRHDKALKLLEELEEMEIIKLLGPTEKIKKDKASKYWGILSKESGEALSHHLKQIRGEWEEQLPNM